jgi:hypothetical protein
MTCDEARERLSALLDEALSPGERSVLDAHLATCVDCRRELGLLRNTVALLRAVDPARAPAGFVDRVRAAARPVPWYRRAPRALSLPWPVKLPLAAAAIVFVGVIVGSLLRTLPDLEQAGRVEAPSPVVTEAPQRPDELGAPPRREVAPTPPPTGRARREERAANPAGAETDTARRRDLAKVAPSPAPAAPAAPAEPKAERQVGPAQSARDAAQRGADVAASRLPARPTTAADVSGQLAVKDREAAARIITELMTKAGGAEVARRTSADATVVELTLPRTAWVEFTRELAALGTWTPDQEPAELPAEIRVALRITE